MGFLGDLGKPFGLMSDVVDKHDKYAPSFMKLKPTLNKLGVGGSAAGASIGQSGATLTERQRLDMNRAERDKDLAEGRKRGEEEFSEGSLGRIRDYRSNDIRQILDERKAGMQGFTTEEQNAYRDQYQTSAQQALQGQLRDQQRSMANSGIRGGAAGAQAAALRAEANKANVANERDMYLANIAQKRAGLSAYEQAIRDTEADDLQRTQYNQGQAGKEKLGRLATEYGYGSLGAADRAGVAQMISAETAGNAMRQSVNAGGGSKW